MEGFAQKGEQFEDKFRRVIEEVDLHAERRIIEESVIEIRNKVIDTKTPFFSQFELKGTHI
jgi:hypothetical protein